MHEMFTNGTIDEDNPTPCDKMTLKTAYSIQHTKRLLTNLCTYLWLYNFMQSSLIATWLPILCPISMSQCDSLIFIS